MIRCMNFVALAAIFLMFVARVAHGQAAEFSLMEASVQSINDAFNAGILTSEQLVQQYLARVAAYDKQAPGINAIIHLNPNALETARRLDAERRLSGPRSVLHGVPVLVKDNMDTFDMPTSAGSLSLRTSIPPDDAFIVSRLREAGAIILGKTNLDEFAAGGIGLSSHGGQTRNPYDVRRIPGGSSAGSAAALAANFATLAIGTDTSGSILEPSSLQSLVGLRPTMGLVSRDGIVPSNLWRDVAGPLGRTVSDVAILLDVIAGVDPQDPSTRALDGLELKPFRDSLRADGLNGARIGFVADFAQIGNRGFRTMFENASAEMSAAGAEIVTLATLGSLPNSLTGDTWYNSFEYDANRYLESLGPAAPYHTVQEIITSGDYLPSLNNPSIGTFANLKGDRSPESDPNFQEVIELRDATRTTLLAAMDAHDLDAIIYPTAAAIPPFIESAPQFWDASFFLSLDMPGFLGFPAVTVPAGFTTEGIPYGIGLLGRPFSEADLLTYAYAFEQATLHRLPPQAMPPLPGQSLTGDFDWNGRLDVRDVDRLLRAVKAGSDLTYDLSGDKRLDNSDISQWISGLAKSYVGDANLDGEFNSGDFVQVFTAGEYEDAVEDNSGWAEGDWDADGDFTSADLVAAFQDAGFELGPRPATVPEPVSLLHLLVGVALASLQSRRRWQLNWPTRSHMRA